MTDRVIVIAKRTLGQVSAQDEEFGREMLAKFLHVLEGLPEKPAAICFYTDGVKVACEDSSALLTLRLLEGVGVRMLICRTCLEYFGLSEKRKIGEVVGMDRILATLAGADSVLFP